MKCSDCDKNAIARGLPPLPFAVFDEFGVPADDRVQDYGEACAAAEREACAKVCDEQALSDENCKCPLAVRGWWPDQVTYRCAAAIRARGET